MEGNFVLCSTNVGGSLLGIVSDIISTPQKKNVKEFLESSVYYD